MGHKFKSGGAEVAVVTLHGKTADSCGDSECAATGGQARLRRRDREWEADALESGVADAVVTLDSLGRIFEWSAGAENLFGHPRSEALGQDFFQLVAPRCGPRACEDASCQRRLCSTAGRSIRLFARRNSGEEIPIEMHTMGGSTEVEGGSVLVVRKAASRGKAGRPSPLAAAIPE